MKRKILIVEDDPSVLEAERLMVESLGHLAMCVNCAEDALEVLRQQSPDAIILDIGLPGRDGYALAKKIKAIRTLEVIPIAFVSGESGSSKITQAFHSGGAIYLSKPFTSSALRTTIEALLNRPTPTVSAEAIS